MNFTTNRIPLDDVCFKVYDPEKKELIHTFDTAALTAQKLGLTTKAVHAAIRTKTRKFAPKLNKEVAIRLGNKAI